MRIHFKNSTEREYFRIRKNIINQNYRARKAGNREEKKLPEIPKRITEASVRRIKKISEAKPKPVVSEKLPPIPTIWDILEDRIIELLDWSVEQITDLKIQELYRTAVDTAKIKVRERIKTNGDTMLDGFGDFQKAFESTINRYKDTNNMTGLIKLVDAINRLLEMKITIKYDHNTLLDTATGELIDV